MQKTTPQFIGIIEAPPTYATLETWKRHLADVQAMDIHPQNVPTKAQLLHSAREMIASKKAEARKISRKPKRSRES
jgi:hypothetical protein